MNDAPRSETFGQGDQVAQVIGAVEPEPLLAVRAGDPPEAATREIDHDPHVQLVHFADERLHLGLGEVELVRVHVDERKLRPRHRMLSDFERRRRVVLHEGKLRRIV